MSASAPLVRPTPYFDRRSTGAVAGSDPTQPDTRRRALAGLIDVAFVTVLTTGLLVLVLRLWEAVPKVPFGYAGPWSREFFAGDATGVLMLIRSIDQGGWWWSPNLNLGAPLGQDLRDFPAGPDHLHLIMLKGLVELLGDPFAAANAYYLLGYVLVALSAWGVLRLLGICRTVAVPVGVLFSFLPYHTGRGPEHLLLAAYFAVPLGGLLLHWHLDGQTAWGPARRSATTGLTSRRLAAVLLIALVLGSSSAYYALYFLVLLATATVIQCLVRWDWRPMLSAALLGVPVLGTLLLNSLPALIYVARNGPNVALERTPGSSVFFGMNLTQLLTPIEDHRLGLLAAVEKAQRTASGWQEPGHSLGLLGAGGLLALGVVLVRRINRGPALPGSRARFRERQAALALLAGLVATAGGGSMIIALLGLGEARVWARMSIFIAFFVVCAIASWLDDALDWWRARSHDGRPWVAWSVLAGVLLFSVWDSTSSKDVPAYGPAQVAFDSDYGFMRKARTLLGDGAMVWQMPYVIFPESDLRIEQAHGYDHFKGYLHAPELRWSYGALKSRPAANWQQAVSRRPLAEQLPMLAAVGFSAVYVDTFALPDDGEVSLKQLQTLLEQEPLTSDDGRLALFDLRPSAERLERRVGAGVLNAAQENLLQRTFRHEFGAGFNAQEFTDVNGRWASGDSAELTLVNPGTRPVEVELDLLVQSRVGGSHDFRLTGPGLRTDLEIWQGPRELNARLVLPPGDTVLRLSSDAPLELERTEDRTFYVSDVLVRGPEVQQVVRACAPRPGSTALSC